MLLAHGTLVALIDSQDWRLLRNAGNEAVPVLVPIKTPALTEPHHAGGPAEAGHAAAIGEWLHHQVLARHLDHIVLIAPPRMLGEVRRHLTPQVRHAITGEVPKDLIGRHETEVLAVIRGV